MFSFSFEVCDRDNAFPGPDVQLSNPTVFDELAFGPLQLRWPAGEIRARVVENMENPHITRLKNRTPHRLSGGEKKRVAIACADSRSPGPPARRAGGRSGPAEPGPDDRYERRVEGSGRTVVTATHDLDSVEEIADKCFVFRSGRVVAEDAPAAVLGNADLLRRTGSVACPRNRHPSGETHSHAHHHHDPSGLRPMSIRDQWG